MKQTHISPFQSRTCAVAAGVRRAWDCSGEALPASIPLYFRYAIADSGAMRAGTRIPADLFTVRTCVGDGHPATRMSLVSSVP
jgi:hypothetical protein